MKESESKRKPGEEEKTTMERWGERERIKTNDKWREEKRQSNKWRGREKK